MPQATKLMQTQNCFKAMLLEQNNMLLAGCCAFPSAAAAAYSSFTQLLPRPSPSTNLKLLMFPAAAARAMLPHGHPAAGRYSGSGCGIYNTVQCGNLTCVQMTLKPCSISGGFQSDALHYMSSIVVGCFKPLAGQREVKQLD
jgi:hypothetical protein